MERTNSKLTFIICYFIFFYHNTIFSQSYNDIVTPRINCLGNVNSYNKDKSYIILENDTLHTLERDVEYLYHLNEGNYSKEIISRYYKQAFRYTTEDSKNVKYIKQWNDDIVIYIDSDFPKVVQKEFETFCEQFKKIRNLNIEFTKNKDKSNFYIKSVNKPVNGYDDQYFESDEERKNFIYTGATYKLVIDNNKKYYAGILSVYISDSSNERLLKQLKQLFFSSLGQFDPSSYYEDSSILSKDYNNSPVLSENDLQLLQLNYVIIYQQKINSNTFVKLLKL